MEIFVWLQHKHGHKSDRDLLFEILAAQHRIEERLDILELRINGIEIVDSGENMKKVQTIWSDGFHGFDATHVQPADWPSGIALSDTTGELVDNHDGTFTVSGSQNDVVTATYLGFTATFDFAAPPPPPAKIAGIEIVDA